MSMNTNRGGAMRGEAKGIRTTTCMICGEQVSNRKSVAVQDGRICKAHPEAAKVVALNAARMRSGQAAVLLAVAA